MILPQISLEDLLSFSASLPSYSSDVVLDSRSVLGYFANLRQSAESIDPSSIEVATTINKISSFLSSSNPAQICCANVFISVLIQHLNYHDTSLLTTQLEVLMRNCITTLGKSLSELSQSSKLSMHTITLLCCFHLLFSILLLTSNQLTLTHRPITLVEHGVSTFVQLLPSLSNHGFLLRLVCHQLHSCIFRMPLQFQQFFVSCLLRHLEGLPDVDLIQNFQSLLKKWNQ
ncbi:hypothetical protein GEMRC1_004757 [Eukaryota sp. GEM-RC1]